MLERLNPTLQFAGPLLQFIRLYCQIDDAAACQHSFDGAEPPLEFIQLQQYRIVGLWCHSATDCQERQYRDNRQNLLFGHACSPLVEVLDLDTPV
jgi:hypothetical protein